VYFRSVLHQKYTEKYQNKDTKKYDGYTTGLSIKIYTLECVCGVFSARTGRYPLVQVKLVRAKRGRRARGTNLLPREALIITALRGCVPASSAGNNNFRVSGGILAIFIVYPELFACCSPLFSPRCICSVHLLLKKKCTTMIPFFVERRVRTRPRLTCPPASEKTSSEQDYRQCHRIQSHAPSEPPLCYTAPC
jgi:hypothetical protein